jgi:membrane protein
VLFDAGRWVIALYLAHATVPSAFGAAASFAALLLWLYYSAQIFLFGAEFTACLGGLRPDP